jgi:hypothetical protein
MLTKSGKCILNILSTNNVSFFAVRTVIPLITTDTLKVLYFTYFHYIVSYGVMFWGNWGNGGKNSPLKRKLLD